MFNTQKKNVQSHINDRLDWVWNLTICSITTCGSQDDFSLYIAIYVFGEAESKEYPQELQQGQTDSYAYDDVYVRHCPVDNGLVATLFK